MVGEVIGGRNTWFFGVFFWLHWVFVGAHWLFLVSGSRGYSLVRGFPILMASVVTEQGSRATRLQ